MIYIKNNSIDPFFNHALEEYYLLNSEEEIFILWRNRRSILIGRNQNTLSEINIEFMKSHQIDLVRRLSGGGTVFCDLGNINFTFITNKSGEKAGFDTFAKPVIQALQSLNIDAKFTGRNDITVDGFKVSGNAQYHYNNRLLHHGTLLYDGNLKDLSGALKSRPEKFIDKSVKSVAARVTNIKKYMVNNMDVLAFREYLKDYIVKSYNMEKIHIPSKDDLTEINKIMNRRFMSWDWNYGKSPKYTYKNIVKYPFGMVEYHILVENGLIKNVEINGDYFGELPIKGLTDLLKNIRYNQVSVNKVLSTSPIHLYISGISLDQLVEGIIQEGLCR